MRRIDATTQTIRTIAGNGTSFDNGVPASSLLLFKPSGVTFDSAGNLYICDSGSDIVRRVTPGGVAFTVAGTGGHALSGDRGLATLASLASPFASIVDADGNLYIADTFNHVVRKVDTAGVITTVAGNGNPGYNGDVIPAASAQLNEPTSVAVDSSGNLYIADFGNNRVRRVSNGVITTVAGTGTNTALNRPETNAFDNRGNLIIGDKMNGLVRSLTPGGIVSTLAGGGNTAFPASNGGLALNAKLGDVLGVAADAAGNIYFSDGTNFVVQKITPAGTLVTVAGNGKPGFSGDGGNATQAQLNGPLQVAVDRAGNLFIADFENNRIRVVYATAPTFQVSPNPMGFSAASGGLPLSQALTVSTGVAGLSYTASVTPPVTWLTLSAVAGQMPASITVTADPSQLPQGTSDANIVIGVPGASPPNQTIPVKIIVAAAQPARLSSDTTQLAFAFSQQGTAATRSLQVGNAGGGRVAFGVKTKTDDGGSWLRVSAASGSATAAQPFPLTVTTDAASLNPGTYTGSVTFNNTSLSSDSLTILVSVTVSARQTIVLSQTGLTFTAVQGGGATPSQTFEVLNPGAGTLNWTLTSTTTDGGNWLSAVPTSGSSTGGQTPAPVSVQVNPGGLAPGSYYGQITVQSPTAQNSPQVLTVVLNLLPAGQDPGPTVLPSGLIFSGVAGGQNPAAQTVIVNNLSATPLTMGSSRTFVGGASNWFSHDPINATVTPNTPLVITVTPQIGGLPAGVVGSLTLIFSDGVTRTVAIRLILAPAGSTAAGSPATFSARTQTAAACIPTTLVPVFTTLGDGFSLPATWPQQVVVRVFDDCGAPLTSGSVVVSFSTAIRRWR